MRTAPPLRRLIEHNDRLQTELTKVEKRNKQLKLRNAELLKNSADLAELTRRTVAPVEDLGSLRYLFMLTYGRSGSTLLQGIINTIPGYLMRGENRDALYHLFRYHSVLDKERASHERTADSSRSAWYGIEWYAADAAIQQMRALVVQTLLRPEPDTTVIGFKEIRWWHQDWPEYLAFLEQLFPQARYIINVRNHKDVAKSAWWVDAKDPMAQLAGYEKQLSGMAEVLGERCYRVDYDEYTADHDALRGLFDWLGETFDRARVDEVMDVKHSH
jgi:hypothetical protein